MQLYYRFAYPEKFWKIVNFIIITERHGYPEETGKSWKNLLKQEAEKKNFMNNVLK